MERNYVYTANATVTSLGSSSDITYGDAMNLVYDVQKWTKGEETTINAGDQKYLLVSPTFMIMKNQRFDNSTIKFYGSGECKVQTVEIYYYDKMVINKNALVINTSMLLQIMQRVIVS